MAAFSFVVYNVTDKEYQHMSLDELDYCELDFAITDNLCVLSSMFTEDDGVMYFSDIYFVKLKDQDEDIDFVDITPADVQIMHDKIKSTAID